MPIAKNLFGLLLTVCATVIVARFLFFLRLTDGLVTLPEVRDEELELLALRKHLFVALSGLQMGHSDCGWH